MTETDISKIHEQLDHIYDQKTIDGKEPLTHLIEQAKLAADFTLRMIEGSHLNRTNVSIIDLGCGGVYTRNVTSMMYNGEMTSHYRPYYMAEMSRRGMKPEQLIGIDIGTPDPELNPLYTHVQADIKSILSSRGEFVDFVNDTLTPEQLQNLKFITSNNLFGNISPEIIGDNDALFDNLWAASSHIAKDKRQFFLINFDGPHDMSFVPSVSSMRGISLMVDERWNRIYNSLYAEKFDQD